MQVSLQDFKRFHKVYSAAAFEFRDMRDLIFGVLEASYGIGFTLGPLIG